jgi:hypothetical protein
MVRVVSITRKSKRRKRNTKVKKVIDMPMHGVSVWRSP